MFGSSGSLGSSIVKIILKKYKKKKFIYIARTKPLVSKGRWYKFDLNNNINKFKYKKLKRCIFLASPHYLKKNMKFQTFNKEYLWIKKIVKNFEIENLVYVSSPSIYLKNHFVGKNKYKIDNGCKPRAVADDLIYNSGNTYSMPLLVYRTELGSSIHPEHIGAFHEGNYNALSNFWVQNGAGIDLADYMNYDPYLGRITENRQAQEQQQQEATMDRE